MQYAWAAVTVIFLLAGTTVAFMSKQKILRSKIQFWTTVAIFVVLLHNIYWERDVNQMTSKGWTLFYTLPSFLICFCLSLILYIVFKIRARK